MLPKTAAERMKLENAENCSRSVKKKQKT